MYAIAIAKEGSFLLHSKTNQINLFFLRQTAFKNSLLQECVRSQAYKFKIMVSFEVWSRPVIPPQGGGGEEFLPLQGHLAMSGDIFGYYKSEVRRPERQVNILQWVGQTPQPRLLQHKMSIGKNSRLRERILVTLA